MSGRPADPAALVMISRPDDRVAFVGLRDALLNVAHHELRTPLAIMLGFTGVLREHRDYLSSDEVDEYLALVDRAGKRLSSLVENVLTLANLDSGALRMLPEVVDVERCVALAARTAGLASDEVVYEAVTKVAVVGDQAQVVSILTNYLTNAALYGSLPVTVTAERDGFVVTVSVADHGPGVTAQFAPELFEDFSQASTGSIREAHGLGLGLSAARALAEAQSGRAWYEPNEGGGSRFCVSLPAAKPAAA